eukprot:6193358-Pleurochrysis_carterae.AAC.2
MFSSDADVSRSLPERRAFTVGTGPLANTPPAPSSSSAFSHPPPSLFQTACFSFHLRKVFSVLSDFWAFTPEGCAFLRLFALCSASTRLTPKMKETVCATSMRSAQAENMSEHAEEPHAKDNKNKQEKPDVITWGGGHTGNIWL